MQISDDEDDVHPNVDTPSLFRWRHDARIKREDEEKAEQAKKMAEERLRLQEIEKLEATVSELELIADPDEATQGKLKAARDKVAERKGQQETFEAKELELAE